MLLMRLLRNLLLIVYVPATVVFAAWTAVKISPDGFPGKAELTQFSQQLLQPMGGDFTVFLTALGVVALGLAVCVLSITPQGKPKDIRVEFEGGSVVMSDSATKSYIENALQEFTDLGIRKITLEHQARGLAVHIISDVKTQKHVPDLEQSIITRVHVALVKELGIKKVSRVTVSISGFQASKANAAKKGSPTPVAATSIAPATEPVVAVEPVAPSPTHTPELPVSPFSEKAIPTPKPFAGFGEEPTSERTEKL